MLARNSFVPRMTLVDVVGFFFPDCYSRVFVFSGGGNSYGEVQCPFLAPSSPEKSHSKTNILIRYHF